MPNIQNASRLALRCAVVFASAGLALCIAPVAGANMGGACSTSGATGALKLYAVASRVNGVAPLAVFFDASGTTAAASKQPFHDLEYRWDFGDEKGSPVNGANWGTGSRANISSRNKSTGPVAAHVFEVAGNYTVALTVTDGSNSVSSRCVQIEVQEPDAVFAGSKTVCVSATGMPVPGVGGCPEGAGTAQESSFPVAIGKYAKTGRRVLFKRGDIFISTTEANITATGPGTIGAYGTGALPLIQMKGTPKESAPALGFSSRSTPKFADWRIMDLAFDGMSNPNSQGLGISPISGGVKQITLLRIAARNMSTAYGFGGDLINYWNNHGFPGHSIDQLFIVDSTSIAGTNTITSCYNAGNRLAFMGNDIDGGGNPKGSHVTRFPYLNKAVISNNNLSRPGFNRTIIKLHAPYWNAKVGVFDPAATIPPSSGADSTNYSAALNGDGYSKQIVISDNKFTDHANPWAVAVGPQDQWKDERVRDVIIERNWFVATATSQSFLAIWAADTTIRNNIFAAGSANVTGAMVTQWGIEPPSTNVHVYNNSFFTSYKSLANEVMPIQLGGAASNITVKNNLGYAPNSANSLTNMISGTGKSGFVASNNTSTKQLYGINPLFSVNPPMKPADFKPGKGSYAIGSGASVPVWSDFFMQHRPQGVIDLGAIELP